MDELRRRVMQFLPHTKNASGDIASFNTKINSPFKSLIASINALQDLHGYAAPYPAGPENAPYLFRSSGGELNSDVIEYKNDLIIGGTIAWNQQAKSLNTSNWAGNFGTAAVTDGVMKYTITEVATAQYGNHLRTSSYFEGKANHKYFAAFTHRESKDGLRVLFTYVASNTGAISDSSTSWIRSCGIGKISSADSGDAKWLAFRLQNGIGTGAATRAVGDWMEVKDAIFIDLTQMFGSAIADYIYTLETNTAGAGVAYFRKLFPKPYYAYDVGSLQSVKASAHKTVGFNAWDEEWEVGGYNTETGAKNTQTNRIRSKNLISVVPNTNYCFTKNTADGEYILYYDAAGNYLSDYGYSATKTHVFTMPADCHYVAFYLAGGYGTTYNHDICINLSWDGERDGEYEPYVQHTYPLDSDLELRGIPKLDANNSLYYDGDEYASDGTVTRKRALITGEWKKSPNFNHIFYRNGLGNKAFGLTTMSTAISNLLPTVVASSLAVLDEMDYGVRVTDIIYAVNKDCSTAEEFNTWATNNGLQVEFELATPTTESADAFENPQEVDPYGTEEYVDSRSVPVPVGHSTVYGNICPISGHTDVDVTRTGKNLLRKGFSTITNGGITFTANEDGTVTANGTSTNANAQVSFSNALAGLPSGDYYVTFQLGENTHERVRGYVWDSTLNTRCVTPSGTAMDFVIKNNVVPIRIDSSHRYAVVCQVAQADLTVSDIVYKPMVTATDVTEFAFESYVSRTYPIPLGRTVYGGTLDVTTGKLNVTWGTIDLSSVNYSYVSGRFISNAAILGMKPSPSGRSADGIMCSAYKCSTSGADMTLFKFTDSHIYIYDSRYSDKDAFKAAVSGVQLVYELAAPIEISLTPTQISTLLGTNNIWHDANGGMAVIYWDF